MSVAKVPKSQVYTFCPHSNILIYERFKISQKSASISKCSYIYEIYFHDRKHSN